MVAKKLDGVIEAVRYTPEGQIELVRAYLWRWKVFSDRVLLDRPALLERLRAGQIFVTGQRTTLRGGVFDTGKQVHLSPGAEPRITTKDQAGSQDFLANVPIF